MASAVSLSSRSVRTMWRLCSNTRVYSTSARTSSLCAAAAAVPSSPVSSANCWPSAPASTPVPVPSRPMLP